MSEGKLLDTVDIQILDIDSIKDIDENQLPEIITSQYNNLTKLEQKIADAVNEAKKAKNRAYDADVKVGWLNKSKKEAIDLLQEASKGLAESQLTLVEAQEISFEYQSKVALIMKFLFGLGASSIAMNRVAVREIKARLEGASDEEISDLAKKELNTVLMQLKAQEDILLKQKKLESTIQDQKRLIQNIQQKDVEHDKKIEKIKEQQRKQDTMIATNTEKLAEHHNALEKLKFKDEEIEQGICNNAKNIHNLESDIKQQKEDQEIKNGVFIKDLSEIKLNVGKQIDDLKDNIKNDNAEIYKKISSLSESFNGHITDVKNNLNKNEGVFEEKLIDVSEEFHKSIVELKNSVDHTNKEIECKLEDLKNKIDNFHNKISKKAWKITISVMASASLLINFLQIFGIIK